MTIRVGRISIGGPSTRCLHRLVLLTAEQKKVLPGYRYKCELCSALFKIATGVVIPDSEDQR